MNNLTPARRLLPEAGAVFIGVMAFLLTLAPSAPFTKELGVCESGAVRDVLAGHIILPYFLPGPMVHVPPLYWWTAALCVKAFGWNELALRLPALVAAGLTCAILFAWCGAVFNRRVGLWSAVALLLCHFWLDAARQPRMDSMLALFVTVAAASLERAITTRRIGYFVAAALSIGLGCLSKGILGIALPGVVVALFLLVRGRWRELFRPELVATFTAGLLVGAGWFLAGYHIGGRAFLDWQVEMNLWSRFIPTAAGGAGYCAHPFWYFGPHTLSGFLPWSLYLPAFAAAAWPRQGRKLPEATVFVLCWFAGIFIFFSSSQGKCLVYILPAFPPLAILAGWTIEEIQATIPRAAIAGNDPTNFASYPLRGEKQEISFPAPGQSGGLNVQRRVFNMPAPEKWMKWLFGLGSAAIGIGATAMVAASILLIGLGLPKIPVRLHPTDRRFLEIFTTMASRLSPALLVWLLVSMAGIGLVVAGLIRRLPVLQAWGTLVIAGTGSWFWFAVMNPALAQRETLKAFAHEIAAVVPLGASIGHFGLGDCELNFYSPKPIPPLTQFSCSDRQSAPQYIVIRARDLGTMIQSAQSRTRDRRRRIMDRASRPRIISGAETEVSDQQLERERLSSCLSVILQSAPVDSLGRRLLLEQTHIPN